MMEKIIQRDPNRISFTSRILMHLLFIIFSICCIVPVWLVISISFTSDKDIVTKGYSLIPPQFTTQAYKFLFMVPDQIINGYIVSIAVTLLGVVAGLWLTMSVAYVTTRKDYPLARFTTLLIFITMLFNGGMVANYILVSNVLHLKNTIWALLLPLLINPWFILITKGFLKSFPYEIIEATKIDGAGEIGTFIKIVLPNSKACMATIGLFIALMYWNDWLQSLLYIEDNKLVSLQYLLIRIMRNIEFINSGLAQGFDRTRFGDIPTISTRMAICILAAGPMLFIFPFFQKYFVKGITLGAIKG